MSLCYCVAMNTTKIRTNIYIRETVKNKIRDIQYMYRKRRKVHKSLSEIVNAVLGSIGTEETIEILDNKPRHGHK